MRTHKLEIKKLVLLVLLILNISYAVVQISSTPLEHGYEDFIPQKKILIIAESELDNQLANKIVQEGPGSPINYTIVDINPTANITELTASISLENYLSIFFIVENFNNNTLTTDVQQILESSVKSGTSIGFISSKLFTFKASYLDFLGIDILHYPEEEEEYELEDDLEFIVNNDSYLQTPYEFNQYQEVEFNGKFCFIKARSTSSISILATNKSLDDHDEIYTAITAKTTAADEGTVIAAPISFTEETNSQLYDLLTSISYYIINRSSNMYSGETNSTQPLDSSDANYLDVLGTFVQNNQPLLAVSAVVGTAAVIGVSSYSIKNKGSKGKKNTEGRTYWSPSFNLILIFLVPFIWLFSKVMYSPSVRKLDREDVLDNEMREEILEILSEYQFDHFNSLKRQLQSGVSILRWHLQVLEDFGMISASKYGQYKLYHLANEKLDPIKVKLYTTIRSDKALDIVNYFMFVSNTCTIQELSQKLYLSQEIVKYHVDKLREIDVIHYDHESHQYKLNTAFNIELKWLSQRLQEQFAS